MRKKLIMVARISSGTWAARIFIMLGQKRPTQNSNMQKATNWICPWNEIPAERSQCCKQHSSHHLTIPDIWGGTRWQMHVHMLHRPTHAVGLATPVPLGAMSHHPVR